MKSATVLFNPVIIYHVKLLYNLVTRYIIVVMLRSGLFEFLSSKSKPTIKNVNVAATDVLQEQSIFTSRANVFTACYIQSLFIEDSC